MKKDEIKSEFAEVKDRLDVYNAQLAEHMSRTALLEKEVEHVVRHFDTRQKAAEKRLDDHEAKFNGLSMRVLHYVSIAGGLVGLIKLLL